MTRSNFKPEVAATVVSGNSGMAVSFPPNTSMFVLIGAASVAPFVSADDLLVALFLGGLWSLAFRLVVMFVFTRRYRISALTRDELPGFGRAFTSGWTSNPVRSFVPLIFAYVIPTVLIGALIGAGLLPILGG